jgi:hypothetical protein
MHYRELYEAIKDMLRMAGENFEIERAGESHSARGHKNSKAGHITFLPEADVQTDDVVRSVASGSQFYIIDVDHLAVDDKVYQLHARYETEAQRAKSAAVDARRQPSVRFRDVNISGVSGQVFLGHFDQVVANLTTAGQTDLASVLDQVKEAILASHGLSDQDKNEHIELVAELGEEVAKPNPNWTKIKAVAGGLASLLKAVPELVEAGKQLGDGIARLQGGP